MRNHPHAFQAVKDDLSDWHLWTGRGVVIAFAALAGLAVVVFTWLTEHAISAFFSFQSQLWWGPLLWTPLCTAAIVWTTRKFFPGAAGSGIPQVLAALEPQVTGQSRKLFVSLKLSIAKIFYIVYKYWYKLFCSRACRRAWWLLHQVHLVPLQLQYLG